jgi:hypothetical protein
MVFAQLLLQFVEIIDLRDCRKSVENGASALAFVLILRLPKRDQITNALEQSSDFIREKGTCVECGDEKKVIRTSSK